jgi:tRNA (cytidine/uridine-2'-O-)-methyltransferase
MIDVVLHQPEIPPNTGNVIRLCANTGARLHLVYPLGFDWDDKRVRRAGLDYHELANVTHHQSWQACHDALIGRRMIAVETGGTLRVDEMQYRQDDVLVFGQETKGLPAEVLAAIPPTQRVTLPMRPDNRSLNLSNAVAVTVFEAWRQLGYVGAVMR